jgi:hypothetical protein
MKKALKIKAGLNNKEIEMLLERFGKRNELLKI